MKEQSYTQFIKRPAGEVQDRNREPQGGSSRFPSDRDDRMGAKNQNPTKSLGLPTKPKKIPRPTFNPKNSHAKFPSHKKYQKALKYYDITRKTETSALNAEKNTC